MIVTLDAKRRLTVPAGLSPASPGDTFDARFDAEENELLLRRLAGGSPRAADGFELAARYRVICAPAKLCGDPDGADAARRIECDAQDGPAFGDIVNESTDDGQACSQARSVRRIERRHDRIGAAPAGTTKSGYESGYKTRHHDDIASSGAGLPAQLLFNV